MNPRQRRGVLLMIVAAFGAIAVFLTIVSYVNTLNRELGTYRTVLRLTQDVDPYQPITEDMVEPYEVPAKFFDEDLFLSDLASADEALSQPGSEPVSATFLHAGTLLQKIYASFQANEQSPACAIRVLTNVEVLDVGDIGSQIDAQTGGTNTVVPVTFRLTPQQALQLTYAESFASKVRLALVSARGAGTPGDMEFCSDDQLAALEQQRNDDEQNPTGPAGN